MHALDLLSQSGRLQRILPLPSPQLPEYVVSWRASLEPHGLLNTPYCSHGETLGAGEDLVQLCAGYAFDIAFFSICN